jgi:hypothetical protein
MCPDTNCFPKAGIFCPSKRANYPRCASAPPESIPAAHSCVHLYRSYRRNARPSHIHSDKYGLETTTRRLKKHAKIQHWWHSIDPPSAGLRRLGGGFGRHCKRYASCFLQLYVNASLLQYRMYILLLLKWHYSPIRTFASIKDFTQSALLFDLSFQFVILHLLISVCAKLHHLLFGRPPSRLLWWLLLNTFSFLLLFILLTRPIQFNTLILTNKIMSESPNSCINSLFRLLQFSITLIPLNVLKTFLSKVTLILCPRIWSLCCPWSYRCLLDFCFFYS